MTHINALEPFETLYKSLLPKLRFIASQTQGETTIDDLMSEVWLLREELQSDKKITTLSNHEVQQNIFLRLYGRFVKFANKGLRYAIRLDHIIDDENGDNKNWLDSLAATSEDHEAYLCRVEEELQQEAQLKGCFSQATAYLRLLENFKSNKAAIAKHLALSLSWLRRKIQRARNHVECQRSLFDNVEEIAENFMPPPKSLKQRKMLSRLEWALIRRRTFAGQKRLFCRMYIPIRKIEAYEKESFSDSRCT